MSERPTMVEFWFDPSCPFTWATSQWVRDLVAAGQVEARWRVMSLAVLNEGRDIPEHYRQAAARSWQPIRVLVAAGRYRDSAAIGRLYEAIGRRTHEHRRSIDEKLLIEALADAGLPPELAGAREDSTLDDLIRASHAESQRRAGTESGSPITAYNSGPGYFGPVVAPVAGRDEAAQLLRAMVALSRVPSFSEVKRVRGTP